MSRVLVVAVGNPLRGDDAIGPLIARHLAATSDEDSMEVVSCRQLTPELAENIAEAQRVIFVDAAVDVPPGQIRWAAVQAGTGTCGTFSHQITPSLLLSYAKSLFSKCPDAIQISIGGASFDFCEGLSAEAQAGYQELVRSLDELCLNRSQASPLRENAGA